MNVLLILASGKSSRFGGFPKAFCKINNEYVVQRTVNLGKKLFSKIYLVMNKEIFPVYKDLIKDCKTISIGTGQGDAHSFLRAARFIKADCGADTVTLCWGDTLFLDDTIFKKASKIELGQDAVGMSFSSWDKEPYAWYETDGEKIKSSHFRAKEGIIPVGIHDQSVFVFNLHVICSQLEQYMMLLGIKDDEDYINNDVSKEMKLLDSFTFFYEENLLPMNYFLVESGKSYSFNTNEELESIRIRTEI